MDNEPQLMGFLQKEMSRRDFLRGSFQALAGMFFFSPEAFLEPQTIGTALLDGQEEPLYASPKELRLQVVQQKGFSYMPDLLPDQKILMYAEWYFSGQRLAHITDPHFTTTLGVERTEYMLHNTHLLPVFTTEDEQAEIVHLNGHAYRGYRIETDQAKKPVRNARGDVLVYESMRMASPAKFMEQPGIKDAPPQTLFGMTCNEGKVVPAAFFQIGEGGAVDLKNPISHGKFPLHYLVPEFART